MRTLKDHVRKKQHRKINPHNKSYDKYYLINYLVSSYHSDTTNVAMVTLVGAR